MSSHAMVPGIQEVFMLAEMFAKNKSALAERVRYLLEACTSERRPKRDPNTNKILTYTVKRKIKDPEGKEQLVDEIFTMEEEITMDEMLRSFFELVIYADYFRNAVNKYALRKIRYSIETVRDYEARGDAGINRARIMKARVREDISEIAQSVYPCVVNMTPGMNDDQMKAFGNQMTNNIQSSAERTYTNMFGGSR
jgi:hypothetical protein